MKSSKIFSFAVLKPQIKKGFTLVELIVVMAVIAILAAITIAGINPSEQLARGRDTGRISAVTQIGKAITTYYTSQNVTYPPAATYNTALVSSQELTLFPTVAAGVATSCTTTAGNQQAGGTGPAAAQLAGANANTAGSGYCYKTDATTPTKVIVYTRLESQSQLNKCPAAGTGTTNYAWAVWTSLDNQVGVVCTNGTTGTVIEPSVQSQVANFK